MLVFPQLAQYPLLKRERVRTVVNALADGSAVKYADPDEWATEWELPVESLTAAEWNAIQTLFAASEGRLQHFTYLDPTANLLTHSEDLSAPAWVNGPLIQLTPGMADPFGTMRATRVINAGQASQRVTQTLAAPAWFPYAFSTWARSDGGATVTLVRATTSGSEARALQVAGVWVRYVCSGNLGRTETAVTFEVELPPGGAVDLFGLQVEAQLAPGAYKKTAARGGVYAKARFAEDQLVGRAEGANQFAGVIRIAHTVEE